MTASGQQPDGIVTKRPQWRTPSFTEDTIVDTTMNVSSVPGDDGLDAVSFPNYTTTGTS
jgi:hypothetical protein